MTLKSFSDMHKLHNRKEKFPQNAKKSSDKSYLYKKV